LKDKDNLLESPLIQDDQTPVPDGTESETPKKPPEADPVTMIEDIPAALDDCSWATLGMQRGLNTSIHYDGEDLRKKCASNSSGQLVAKFSDCKKPLIGSGCMCFTNDIIIKETLGQVFIVTAAHCVFRYNIETHKMEIPSNLTFLYGKHGKYLVYKACPGYEVQIKKIFVHKNYEEKVANQYDLAFLIPNFPEGTKFTDLDPNILDVSFPDGTNKEAFLFCQYGNPSDY